MSTSDPFSQHPDPSRDRLPGGASGPAPGGPPPAYGYPAPPAQPSPWRGRRGLATLALVGVTSGLVGGAAGAALYEVAAPDRPTESTASTGSTAETSQSTSGSQPAAEAGVQQVANAVTPSVVLLQVQGAQGSGEGSGVILSADGLILTNNHVVEAAGSGGEIRAVFDDGSTAPASIVGRDPLTDLAVVQAKGVNGLKPATLGKSADLQVGEQVVAIGAPLGLQGTVTTGIVSALDRPVSASGEGGQATVISAIQTDAAVNPGNSGGPLVDMSGRVVGINSAIASLGGQSGSIGLGFAIPVDQARRILPELESGTQVAHAMLGVSVGDSQDPLGALVGAVTPGSAADSAGLQRGDVLTRVDDRIVNNADALVAAIRSHSPGAKVTVHYVRDGSEQTATITLGSDQAST